MSIGKVYKNILGNLEKNKFIQQKIINTYSLITDEKIGNYLKASEKNSFLRSSKKLINDSKKHQRRIKKLINKYAQR